MSRTADQKVIAVVGASGQQGGGVVRALQARGRFRVRALSRNPDRHRHLADEVAQADLDQPETLTAALHGAHGVFAVTNFWSEGSDEHKQATAAIAAAKDAGVDHFIWSTLPNVEAISGGAFEVRHFAGKARIDPLVAAAGFAHHTFVVAPFYYQNLLGAFAPQMQPRGSMGWTLPLDPEVRCLHTGDIGELGHIVAGAFEQPDRAGQGQYLPLVGDFMRFRDMVDALNAQGHSFTIDQVPPEAFASFFPGAAELAEMFQYFQTHTYLGADWSDRIALANTIAGTRPRTFAEWAREHFTVRAA
jgi:uncharacterized protein YbjT (DUF2867 family)